MVAFSIDLGINTILTSNNVITQFLKKKKEKEKEKKKSIVKNMLQMMNDLFSKK